MMVIEYIIFQWIAAIELWEKHNAQICKVAVYNKYMYIIIFICKTQHIFKE